MRTMAPIRNTLASQAGALGLLLAAGTFACFFWVSMLGHEAEYQSGGLTDFGSIFYYVPPRWWWIALHIGLTGALLFAWLRLSKAEPDAAMSGAMAACLAIILAIVIAFFVTDVRPGVLKLSEDPLYDGLGAAMLIPPLAALALPLLCAFAYALSRRGFWLWLFLVLPTGCRILQLSIGLIKPAWRFVLFHLWTDWLYMCVGGGAYLLVVWFVLKKVSAPRSRRIWRVAIGLVLLPWAMFVQPVIRKSNTSISPRSGLVLLAWGLLAGAQYGFALPLSCMMFGIWTDVPIGWNSILILNLAFVAAELVLVCMILDRRGRWRQSGKRPSPRTRKITGRGQAEG